MICEDCYWNDNGDCMCFHDEPSKDCSDFELKDDEEEVEE